MGKTAMERHVAELFDGRRWSEDEARRVLGACATSGESVTEFAKRHGIDSQRLYWWRRRLGGEAEVVQPSSTEFVPVTVRKAASAADIAAVVVSLGGVRIDVREIDAATASWVSMVVTSLGQAQS